MLSTLESLKVSIGILDTDTSQDARLTQLLIAADAVLKEYVKRQLEAAVYVHFPFRLGGEAIVLPETPVLCYRLTGNIVEGQPTVTGLSSTSSLMVGMPALQAVSYNGVATQPFPNGATIQSIDSASQVTLTGNATLTQSGVLFVFGLAVWYDPQGSWGDGIGSDPSGPFGAGSLLRAGLDYGLQRDQPDGSSKSGKLTRLSSTFGYLGMAGEWSAYGNAWSGLQSRGTLSTPLPPLWPKYPPGSIKVVYCGGLTAIPADLVQAENNLAAYIWMTASNGGLLAQSESFQGYNYSLAQIEDALKSDSKLASTRQILSRYRRLSL